MNILFRRNIYLYKNYSGTYSNKYIGVFVSKSDINYFYRNSFIFIDGEKVKYEIVSIDDNILKRKGKLELQQQRKDESNNIKVEVYQPDESPLSESVDKMTIQFGFIFYILVNLVNGKGKNVSPMIYIFTFCFIK